MDTTKISARIADSMTAKGKLPAELEDDKFTKTNNPNPKGNDRDGDGKTNEAKPFKGSEVPRGVVAALTFQGEIRIYNANGPKAAEGIKRALQASDGEYARIAAGQNTESLTINELYDHFEERWAGEVPEAFKKNWKNKGKGDDKKDDDKSDKKDDKDSKGKPPWLKGDKKKDKKSSECGCGEPGADEDEE